MSLFDVDYAIDINVSQLVHLPTRPPYFEKIHFARFSQPKMNTQIILGKVTSAAANFIYLL